MREPTSPFRARAFATGVALTVAALSSCAHAQFTAPITATDGPAFFRINPYSGGSIGSGPSCSLSGTGQDGLNFLNQAWWWARVDGEDIREFALIQNGASVSNPTPNQIRIEYSAGAGRQWRIVMQFTVNTLGGNAAELIQRLSITNNGATDVGSLSVFNFNNVTLNGTSSNDLVTRTGPNELDFVDGSNTLYHGFYQPVNPSSLAGGVNLRGLLTNNSVDNLPDGVLESGPGDLEAASQWSVALPAGATQVFEVRYVALPSPGAAALLALGGLLASRRRR